MLNCSTLISKYQSKNPNQDYYPTKNKRNYECDLIDITASEVKLNGEQCFTNKRHINKRQKLFD